MVGLRGAGIYTHHRAANIADQALYCDDLVRYHFHFIRYCRVVVMLRSSIISSYDRSEPIRDWQSKLSDISMMRSVDGE